MTERSNNSTPDPSGGRKAAGSSAVPTREGRESSCCSGRVCTQTVIDNERAEMGAIRRDVEREWHRLLADLASEVERPFWSTKETIAWNAMNSAITLRFRQKDIARRARALKCR